MDISNLPTDNLYKFLATSGLLVLLFSYAAPEYALIKLEMKKAEIISSRENLVIEGEAIELKLKSLEINQRIDEAISKSNTNKDTNNEPELIAKLKSLQSSQENLLNENKLVIEWRKKARDQEKQNEQIEIISRQLSKYSMHAFIGKTLGLLVTAFGFSMWYYRTQRHIDASMQSARDQPL